jgi:dihydropteroate synthase
MGIINVTPDSFYPGSRASTVEQAVERAVEMEAEGAAFVDVGGESTRPGAHPVPEEEEAARVVPVVQELARCLQRARISVDTRRESVARAAVAAGATLINDVSASLYEVAAAEGVGWVCMHMKGTPRTMQDDPRYDDVVAEVRAFLEERIERARAAGVAEVYADVGFGFGKRPEHNLALLRSLPCFRSLGVPLLLGVSRKSSIGVWSDPASPPPPEDRLPGTIAAEVFAVLAADVDVLRVHDVGATRQALQVVKAIREAEHGT